GEMLPAIRQSVLLFHECLRAGCEAAADCGVLWANLLPLRKPYARTVQGFVSVHGQFGSPRHGRGDHELQRATELYCIQCWLPSIGNGATGGDCPTTKCSSVNEWAAEQELGRVREA